MAQRPGSAANYAWKEIIVNNFKQFLIWWLRSLQTTFMEYFPKFLDKLGTLVFYMSIIVLAMCAVCYFLLALVAIFTDTPAGPGVVMVTKVVILPTLVVIYQYFQDRWQHWQWEMAETQRLLSKK